MHLKGNLVSISRPSDLGRREDEERLAQPPLVPARRSGNLCPIYADVGHPIAETIRLLPSFETFQQDGKRCATDVVSSRRGHITREIRGHRETNRWPLSESGVVPYWPDLNLNEFKCVLKLKLPLVL